MKTEPIDITLKYNTNKDTFNRKLIHSAVCGFEPRQE